MLKLKPEQRALIAEKIPDLANVAIGALVFGQFLSDRPFSPVVALFGVGAWAVLMAGALVSAGDDRW